MLKTDVTSVVMTFTKFKFSQEKWHKGEINVGLNYVYIYIYLYKEPDVIYLGFNNRFISIILCQNYPDKMVGET